MSGPVGPFFIPDAERRKCGQMSVTREQLLELLEPEVESLGYELAELEVNLTHGRGLIRIFIDGPEGITLDDCSKVSHQVSGLLDVEDPIQADYNLEVSSPGADRKLVKPEHFDRFAGHAVKMKLRRLVSGRRRLKGQLLGREGDVVEVKVDDKTYTINLDDIDVVRLVPDWNEYQQTGTA